MVRNPQDVGVAVETADPSADPIAGGTLRVLGPAKYDKSSSLTRVEPPRWFTARRKLVKFKSAFKTGLARCPAPPCKQVLPARDTAGLRQEFIALTFLGSFGWISLLNPFLPAALQIVASFGAPCVVLSPLPPPSPEIPRTDSAPNRHDDHRSRYPGETSRAMLPSDRTLLAPH